MSFLSSSRFADNNSAGEIPKQVRIARMLLWVQAVIGILLSALIVFGTYTQQQLSDAELAEVIKERIGADAYKDAFKDGGPTQEMFSYWQLYLLSALMVVLLLVLVLCALRITDRKKSTRLVALVAEGVLIPFSLWQLNLIGCALILPGMAVFVMLLSRPVKDWYDTEAEAAD